MHGKAPGEVVTIDLTAHSMVLEAGEKMALHLLFQPDHHYHGYLWQHGGGLLFTSDAITVGMRIIVFGRKTGGNGVKGL